MRWRELLVTLAAILLGSASLPAVAVRPVKKKVDPVKEELAKLEGEWLIVSYVQSGQDYTNQFAGNMRRLLKGNRWDTIANGQTTQYTFTIDPSKNPKTIDISMVGAGESGKARPCIYELKGDTLTLCQAQAGQKRPTSFTSDAQSGLIVTIATRQRPK